MTSRRPGSWVGCNTAVQDSPLLRNTPTAPWRHQNKAGGSRTSGLSKPKHPAHHFGMADRPPACKEAKSTLAVQQARQHPGCNPAEKPCHDLLEIRRATQSVFLQPLGLGSEMNTPPFSPHFRPEVNSCHFRFGFPPTHTHFADGFINRKKLKKTRKARRNPNTGQVQRWSKDLLKY